LVSAVHAVLGGLCVGVNLAAASWGGWCWFRVESSRAFWVLLRAGQAFLLLTAIDGGILLLTGRHVPGSLHFIYGLVPIAVSFVAEQLRVGAAEAVLYTRGLEDAGAVRTLPEGEQRSIVVQILRRELGVMALSALVVVGLTLRAALGHGSF
jgi:hypothetical protein